MVVCKIGTADKKEAQLPESRDGGSADWAGRLEGVTTLSPNEDEIQVMLPGDS